jgi:hypothetical protein
MTRKGVKLQTAWCPEQHYVLSQSRTLIELPQEYDDSGICIYCKRLPASRVRMVCPTCHRTFASAIPDFPFALDCPRCDI